MISSVKVNSSLTAVLALVFVTQCGEVVAERDSTSAVRDLGSALSQVRPAGVVIQPRADAAKGLSRGSVDRASEGAKFKVAALDAEYTEAATAGTLADNYGPSAGPQEELLGFVTAEADPVDQLGLANVAWLFVVAVLGFSVVARRQPQGR